MYCTFIPYIGDHSSIRYCALEDPVANYAANLVSPCLWDKACKLRPRCDCCQV